MSTEKMRKEFEAAFTEEMVARCGEGYRSSVEFFFVEKEPDGEYSNPIAHAGWFGWRASCETLKAENEILRRGLKGDYDLDAWLDWAKEAEALRKENERLQRFETAYKEFSDKTGWVRPNAAAHELGMHVADILRKRCDDLTSHNQAQADEIKALRLDAERYRFIRSSNSKGKVDICVLHVRRSAGDQGREIICDRECDERIDTAMAQEQQP